MSYHLIRHQKAALTRELPAQQLERWSKQYRVKAYLLIVLFSLGFLFMGPLLDLLVGQTIAFLVVCIQAGASAGAIMLYYNNRFNKKARNNYGR